MATNAPDYLPVYSLSEQNAPTTDDYVVYQGAGSTGDVGLVNIQTFISTFTSAIATAMASGTNPISESLNEIVANAVRVSAPATTIADSTDILTLAIGEYSGSQNNTYTNLPSGLSGTNFKLEMMYRIGERKAALIYGGNGEVYYNAQTGTSSWSGWTRFASVNYVQEQTGGVVTESVNIGANVSKDITIPNAYRGIFFLNGASSVNAKDVLVVSSTSGGSVLYYSLRSSSTSVLSYSTSTNTLTITTTAAVSLTVMNTSSNTATIDT